MTDFTIHVGDVREHLAQIPDGSIQTCITSPPYWGLRDYGTDGQLGLEETPEQYVENMVGVFREVRRTLRDDGTLWLNLGDSYAGSWGNQGRKPERGTQRPINGEMLTPVHDGRYPSKGSNTGAAPIGLKPKDLVGIPWRLAFALQADGWYLRSDIIWAKPNPMPESVRDRPTKSHEHIFLLTKSARYYFDQDAVREASVPSGWDKQRARGVDTWAYNDTPERNAGAGNGNNRGGLPFASGRNIRDVWTITTKPFPGAHFAVFPPEIPSRCIRAGTSERGCCAKCGAPMMRVVERETMEVRPGPNRLEKQAVQDARTAVGGTVTRPASSTTVGWEPSCDCDSGTTACTVLDPFAGSGTTGIVASKLGRHFVGVELNPEYAELARRRIMDAPMSLFSA